MDRRLKDVADVRFSNVDKISRPGERPVRLCNYTDVYNNDYITSGLEFMEATATHFEITKFGLRVGDVLLTKDSETPNDIGIPTVVDQTADDLVCGYHLALIRPDSERVDPTYLSKQLGHHRIARYFGQQANGTTRYGLSTSSIEQTPLELPQIKNQIAIGRILRLLDEAIQKTQAVIAKLKQIRAGMLHDLLTYGLDKDGQLRDPSAHPEQFKDSELGRIPKEWEVLSMEEVALQITDGEHQTPRRTDSGVPLLSARNILNGTIALDDVDFISEEEYLRISNRYCPQYGDILISCSGTIGRVCMIPEGFCCGLVRSVAIVKLQQDIACPKFVEILVSAPLLQRQLLAGQRQLAQANLFQSEIRRLVLPIPTPHEQEEIVEKLEEVDASLQTEQSSVTKLAGVKSGLMNDLLSGAVPVPAGLDQAEEVLNA